MSKFFAFSLMLVAANILSAQQLLTPELLWKIGRVNLEDVSRDGSMAVYSVGRYNVPENKSTKTLYLVQTASGTTTPITPETFKSGDAQFTPDGKRVGFLRDGNLYEVNITDRSETLVSETSMNSFKYSTDGKYIVFAQDVKIDQTPGEIYPDLAKTSGRVTDGLLYRHWDSWHDYAYSHVFFAPYADGKLTAKPTDIMAGEKFDAPLNPNGGIEQVQFSPDGRFIAYTCRKLTGTAEAQSTNSDIYVYELSSGKTINFTSDLPGYDQDPIFSPDGHYLAWTSMETAGNESDRTRLMALNLYTQQREELTEGWKWECNGPQWASDSKSLYFLSSNDFTYQVYNIGVTDKKIKRITEGLHDYTHIKVAGNEIIATRNAMDTPAEVYAVNTTSGSARQLSFATKDPWEGIKKGKVERRTVRTTDGKNMNVWVILPPDFNPKKKYPALLYCQGGPQSALSQFFSYRWNMQIMAANGYVVIAPCRRGMPGGPEGQDWNAAISRDWGGQPMQDLLSAIDDVKKEPWINADKIGAVGASFGGYSVYWLAGHNENKRFKAFVSHCGMFNTMSWWGTTEEMWFAKYDLGDDYWTKPNDPAWNQFSPHLYVKNWNTPMMVIHNEKDFRVPFSEGMQAFQAAQMRGVPSRLLTFPDEGHWMLKPQNSILWQREYFKWLDQWLK
jgi:dipeptidyl aminopeptidase/acylaminoacyl peptidase